MIALPSSFLVVDSAIRVELYEIKIRIILLKFNINLHSMLYKNSLLHETSYHSTG